MKKDVSPANVRINAMEFDASAVKFALWRMSIVSKAQNAQRSQDVSFCASFHSHNNKYT